jgi:hypothetical protein
MSMVRSRHVDQAGLREFVADALAAGLPICAPSIDDLERYFLPECLLDSIRRRGLEVRLTADRANVTLDPDMPLWLAIAVTEHHDDVVELMQGHFLGSWEAPS